MGFEGEKRKDGEEDEDKRRDIAEMIKALGEQSRPGRMHEIEEEKTRDEKKPPEREK